jgi:hypothetical protein
VTVWVFIALGLSLAFVLVAILFSASRALQAWRTFKRFRRRVFDNLDVLSRRIEHVEQGLARADASSARLQHAQADLQEAIAELRILTAAFAEAQEVYATVTGFMLAK